MLADASRIQIAGPLSRTRLEEDDQASGTIYVLRSKSDHPVVAANRDLVHKIGVTGGSVEQRIAGAKLHPTFLMADVEIVATYELSNINRTKLENLIHRIFDPARLDIEIKDRSEIPLFRVNGFSCRYSLSTRRLSESGTEQSPTISMIPDWRPLSELTKVGDLDGAIKFG